MNEKKPRACDVDEREHVERLVTTPQASHKEFAVQHTRGEDKTGGERKEET